MVAVSTSILLASPHGQARTSIGTFGILSATMNDNDHDEMDMFASLGGSLMKDLLADLAVDDDDTAQWFSLAQLEKELKQMEQTSTMDGMVDHTNAANTAAGMVVQNQMAVAQQAFGNAAYSYPLSSDPPALQQQQPLLYHPASLSTLDAWSSTLANAATLQDFLQADTARKSSTAAAASSASASGLVAPPPPGLSSASFRPYDVNEAVTLEPPPGLVPDVSRHVLAQTAVRLQELQQVEEEVVSKSPRSTKSKIAVNGATDATLVQQLTLGLEQIREERALDEDHEMSGGNAAAAAAATDSPGEDGMRTPPLKSVSSDRFRSIPKPSPVTPQNSITFSMPASSSSSSRMVAPTPQPTPVTVKTVQQPEMDAPLLNNVMTIVPNLAPEGADQTAASATGFVRTTLAPIPEPDSDVVRPPMPSPPVQSVGTTLAAAPMDGSSTAMVATTPMVAPLLGVPVSSQSGQAWQMTPPPPTRTRPVYANPHPAAAPVPATALASRFMTARDISYVVHSMLKPILVAETAGAMSTYHIAYWMRHHPVKPPQPPRRPHTEKAVTTSDILSVETDARRQKAKEWSTERKVLGPTAKANVARPRALLSLSKAMDVSDAVVTDENDSTNRQQQRAALWKSRIYCDQAYQSLSAVIEAWQKQSHSASGDQNGITMVGAPSASVQPHLVKLTKCLGISIQTVVADATTLARNQYSVDRHVLQLLLRLPKGKVLLARVLEQALLPPAMVSALLPTALAVLMATPSASSSSSSLSSSQYHGGEPEDAAVAWADDRVFAAWTVVLQRLADLPGSAVLAAVQAIVQASSSEDSDGEGGSALSSTARMQCTHALLQRGSAMSSADVVFAKEWATTEASFMNLLAGL
jgi:hypothetical protein